VSTRRLATALALLGASVACGSGDGDDGVPSVAKLGKPTPAYVATALGGDSVDLAGLRGKVVLLNVWATWCHPCREEIPALQRLYETRRGEGFEVIGVSVDATGSDAAIRSFADEFGMTYPVWRDPDERVQSLFLAVGVPASYLIDREGILRWRRIGIIREEDPNFRAVLDSLLGPRTN
jgi:thiol-disulfide isomerase/thioredoxin